MLWTHKTPLQTCHAHAHFNIQVLPLSPHTPRNCFAYRTSAHRYRLPQILLYRRIYFHQLHRQGHHLGSHPSLPLCRLRSLCFLPFLRVYREFRVSQLLFLSGTIRRYPTGSFISIHVILRRFSVSPFPLLRRTLPGCVRYPCTMSHRI